MVINVNFKVGDYVTRVSHNHDIVFRIINISGNNVYLSGVNVRLCADSYIDDLVIVADRDNEDDEIIQRNMKSLNMDRNNFFYLPGKILHIDGDDIYNI